MANHLFPVLLNRSRYNIKDGGIRWSGTISSLNSPNLQFYTLHSLSPSSSYGTNFLSKIVSRIYSSLFPNSSARSSRWQRSSWTS